ncbi:MAG: CPBP family intramembrane glutamic endopeptidase [Acetivibrio sp.]
MKKTGKILTGFLIVVGAMALREMVSMFQLIAYAGYQIISGKNGTEEVTASLNNMVQNTENLLLISAIGTLVWIMVFGFIYKKQRKIEGKNLFNKKIKVSRIFVLAFMGMGLQLFINSILGTFLKVAPELMENYKQLVQSLGMGNSLISLLYIVVIAPIGEELVFRGVVENYMKKHIKFITANIFQALFFGIYHMNVVQGIYAFFLGLLLGWVANKYGSVRESIILHMAVNLSGCLVGFLLPEVFVNTYVGLLALFIVSLGMVAFSIKTVKMEKETIEKASMVEE